MAVEDAAGAAGAVGDAPVASSALQLVVVDGSTGRMLEVPLQPDASEQSAVELARATALEWASVDYADAESEFAFQVSSSANASVLEGRVPIQGGLVRVSQEGAVADVRGPDFDLEGFWVSAQDRFVEESQVLAPDAMEAVLVAPLSPSVASASAEGADVADAAPRQRKMPAGVRALRKQFSVEQSREAPGYDRARVIDPPR